MDYIEVSNFINKAKKFGSRLDLTRITKLCELLGNPEDKCKFIHIAGTNGKGSVSAFIHGVLKNTGLKTGLFTSPFIYDFNERIQINGESISDEKLIAVMEKVKCATEQMVSEGFEHPTEFELITACAFLYFEEEKCDIAVLEVGLGGILDSTNVIKNPLASIITSIGYDHTEYLGNTLEEIAKNKCGIIKENSYVISYPLQKDEALQVIEKTCKEKKSKLIIPNLSELEIKNVSLLGNEFVYRGISYKTALIGKYQIYNAIAAISALEMLLNCGYKITTENIQNGLKHAKWPARFEILRKKPFVIADGSHNEDGMTSFVREASKLLESKKTVCVFGMLKDKAYDKCLKLLSQISDTVIVTEVDSPRFETVENLSASAKKYFKNVYSEKENLEAVKKAKEIADDDGVIVALGSLYMMKNIKDAVDKVF